MSGDSKTTPPPSRGVAGRGNGPSAVPAGGPAVPPWSPSDDVMSPVTRVLMGGGARGRGRGHTMRAVRALARAHQPSELSPTSAAQHAAPTTNGGRGVGTLRQAASGGGGGGAGAGRGGGRGGGGGGGFGAIASPTDAMRSPVTQALDARRSRQLPRRRSVVLLQHT